MPKPFLLIGAAVFAGALVIGGIKLREMTRSSGDLEGSKAPAIAARTLDNKSVSLADAKGKVLLVDFWATWCPPCRASLPHIQKLASDPSLAQQGLVVWAVNAQERAEDVQPFMELNKYTFTVPMDLDGAIQRAYHVEGIPMTVVIGRDGVVRRVFVGYSEGVAAEIDRVVAATLKE